MAQGQDLVAPATESFTIPPRVYRRLALASLLLIVAIIVVGAAVRLTGSGLGCADWPNCSSRFIEFGDPNQTMEQANRILSGLGAIVAAALVAVGARRRRPYRRDLFLLSLGLVAGVFANIPLGGITVLVGLHPAAVSSHFVLGMVMLTIATVLLWRASHDEGRRVPLVGAADIALSRVMLVALAALMLTGPVLTGSGPHAGDASARRFGFAVPDMARIHSLNMWVFLVCAVLLLFRVARKGRIDGLFRRGYALLGAIAFQGLIGYVQYELGIPAWLVILHVIGSTVVVISTVWFHLGLFTVVPAEAASGSSATSEALNGDVVGATAPARAQATSNGSPAPTSAVSTP